MTNIDEEARESVKQRYDKRFANIKGCNRETV